MCKINCRRANFDVIFCEKFNFSGFLLSEALFVTNFVGGETNFRVLTRPSE